MEAPFGRDDPNKATRRYSDPEPNAPRTWVVNVKMTVSLFPRTRAKVQPFKETNPGRGFATSIHSGLGCGLTSLITTFVAA